MSDPHAFDSPDFRRGYILAVLALALVVRLAYVIQLRRSVLFEQPQGDALLHFNLAREISGGDWLGVSIFYYAPLYPYVVAMVFALTGPSVLAVAIFQVVLSTMDVWIIATLARRLFGNRVALISGVLAALYGPFVFYSGFLLKETVGLVLLDAFVLLSIVAVQHGSWGLNFVGGVLFGLTALVRPNLLPLALPVMGWLWFERRRLGLLNQGASILLFVAGVAAAILPVALRNFMVGKEWVLISAHGGHNFFIGNRVAANGLYKPLVPGGGQSPYEEERDARAIAEQDKGRRLRASEVSMYWYTRGWQEIRRYPGNFIRVTFLKLALFWNDYEVPDFQDFYFLRRQCPLLWLAPLTFGLVTPIAVVGLVANRRQWRSCLLLYLIIVGVLASVLPFFVFARYRLPIVPVLLVFASAGVANVLDQIALRNWNGLKLAVAGAVAVAIVVNWPIYRPIDFLATSYFNMGNLYQAAGQTDDAIAAFSEAVRLDPYYRKPWRALGETYFNAGQFSDAANSLSHSAAFTWPGFSADPDVTFMLGISYCKSGQLSAGGRILSTGQAVWPNDRRFADALTELSTRTDPAPRK